MKVTLTQFVKGLGAPGAVVDTSPGYARNFLLPRKMAVLGEQRLTSGTATVVPATSAASQLQRLEQHSIVFSGAADEHTQTLYAGVGPQQIITEVKKQTGIDVSGSNFREFHALKKIGTHLVKARLHGQDFTIRCIIKSHHAKD